KIHLLSKILTNVTTIASSPGGTTTKPVNASHKPIAIAGIARTYAPMHRKRWDSSSRVMTSSSSPFIATPFNKCSRSVLVSAISSFDLLLLV
ncbi:hypothetical protein ACHAXS_006802, partial [Conticribra weissflogii]